MVESPMIRFVPLAVWLLIEVMLLMGCVQSNPPTEAACNNTCRENCVQAYAAPAQCQPDCARICRDG